MLRSILKTQEADMVEESDEICVNCYNQFRSQVSVAESSAKQDSSSSSTEDPTFHDPLELVESVNEELALEDTGISPLRPPADVRHSLLYAKRKQEQIVEAVSKKSRRCIGRAYGVDLPGPSVDNSQMDELLGNIRQAYVACKTIQERCRVLTLLPSSLSQGEIQRTIPEATIYLIRKSKKLRENGGVWATYDQYAGRNIIDPEHVKIALEYYLNDDLDCSIQSPRPRDVVRVRGADGTNLVPKRYMSRTIRESYLKLREAHPEVKIGLTKFYSLRPAHVVTSPYREECVCVHCANYELCMSAISHVSEEAPTLQDITLLCLCKTQTRLCILGKCELCPGADALTIDTLKLSADAEEIEATVWEHNALRNLVLRTDDFLALVRKWLFGYISHDYVRSAQRSAIWTEKIVEDPRKIVLHFDYAENWTIVYSSEIQSYHWQKKQITIFTCVLTTSSSPRSFAVVSDDLHHDTAFTLLALKKIDEFLDEVGPIYTSCTYVSDGAAAHFKNRFQFYELKSNAYVQKWLFSAPGHGKNACDGIGGVVKHSASIYNLRSAASGAIQNANDLIRKLQPKLPNVTLILVSREEAEAFREKKKANEWTSVPAVPKLRSSYTWVKQGEEVVCEPL